MQSNSVPLNSEIVLEPYPLPGFHLMQWSQDWSVRSPQDQPQPTHGRWEISVDSIWRWQHWCTETLDPWWRGYWGQTELGFQLFHRCTESVTDGSRWVDWTEGLLGQTGFDGKAEGTNPSEAGNRSKHFGWLQKMSGATEKNFFQWLRFKWIGAWKIWLLRLSKISCLGGCYKATVRWAMSIKNKRKKY